jgi:hypothetical protein
MAATNPQTPKVTNLITGRVILKESGLGIPDLLVVASNVAKQVVGTRGGAARAASTPTSNMSGNRIGSVLTATDGTFSLCYEDTEFRASGATVSRPDLMLMVLAPEDTDQNSTPKLLYKNAVPRQSSGKCESYFIRLTTSQLENAGVPVPKTEDEDTEAQLVNYRSLQRSKLQLNKGIADFHKEVLDTHVEDKRTFRSKVLKSLVTDLSAVTPTGIVVKEGESILTKNGDVIDKGIDQANHVLASTNNGVPVNLYLTPENKAKLQHYFDNAVNGIAEIPESDIGPLLFGAASSENIGTLLVKSNPIVKYCHEKTFEETCAIDHLGNGGHDHSGGGGTAPETTPVNITSADIPGYINRLVADMASPDAVMKPGTIPSRPTKADIEKSLTEFSLRKGPADVPAYYDFHSLQIAFEHVWKQLFDEDIVNSGYLLHQSLKSKTGISLLSQPTINIEVLRGLVLTAVSSELEELPVEVAAQFEITKEEWTELSVPFRTQLSTLARRIDNLLYKTIPAVYTRGNVEVRDHRTGAVNVVPKAISLEEAKLKQFLVEQGERIIDTVRHDDYYTMHKTLRDLQDSLSVQYEYTVFAADKDHCSVNFGLLNTFRQEWTPLNYQVGKLCKTIPLAPKEERKYSLTVKKHTKRSEKDARKSNTSFTTEQSETSRAEAEIVSKAVNKTSFNLSTDGSYNIGISKGDSKTNLGIEAQNESTQTRKDFREAVLKAIQEYKDERSFEIATEETADTELTDSGIISNPNDELAVTYLFYELQRRYRISEQLYRVMPVVLVAQPVPQPNEITEAWVISHDWIINRFLLDDSFKPALEYLSTKSVGDDTALRELRRNLRQQRNLVETLKIELSLGRAEADNRYRALEARLRERIEEERREETDGWFSDVVDFFGGGGQSPEAAKARELAAKDAHQYAVEKAEKMAAAVRQEVDTLHRLTAEYNKTLRDHLDNETRVKRLLLHIRNHMIYYMQAIWSMEPPDQRFLRLQKVQAPHLELDDTDGSGRTYRVEVAVSEDLLASFRPPGTEKHKATVIGRLKKPFISKPLVEVAELDKPLGFKGNYMIFPMKQHNALTEFMAAPYIDSAFGAMDPDELSNINLNEFATFICCLHDHEPEKFEELKGVLKHWFTQILADPLRNGDEVVIPSGSLYIEMLPSANSLLENFKLLHRELDVYKVQADIRKAELENLRLADRLLNAEREDPDVEKKIVVEGNGVIMTPDPN